MTIIKPSTLLGRTPPNIDFLIKSQINRYRGDATKMQFRCNLGAVKIVLKHFSRWVGGWLGLGDRRS